MTSEIIISGTATIVVAQTVKLFIEYWKTNKINLSKLWDTGGMPSSHSAFIASIILSVLFVEGWTTLSVVTIAFGLIVIRDAFGIRRETGEQARTINKIIADLKLEKFKINKLRELVGHTGVEVSAGLVLGFLVSVIVHYAK